MSRLLSLHAATNLRPTPPQKGGGCRRAHALYVTFPGGGGGTLIFSHIRRLGLFFRFKILNFNIFWGFEKNEYLGGGGMKILWKFFGGHHKIGLV